ncbi:DUF1330 domain-containing protein [Litoreibacter janthinus]|uniref:Uncharacterized conserved protein, DUF1330 family n=1 Tax=Litoreibacter janthinus TaxID=670154 RepID=A0A1I6HFF3_9RHOB|nr:DUF1330 domain-containing protein [Litoreibacter janthinus]SFR53111.1 Uncharacterized conserved protein, DUF1330 family [Litoreibacter janthinus]
MPKAYWIAHVDVSDPETYEQYKAANAAPFAKYGARFVVRGGAQEVREGASRSRTVVIEFPSLEAARNCYDSADYQAAKAIRDPISQADLVIVEGYDA